MTVESSAPLHVSLLPSSLSGCGATRGVVRRFDSGPGGGGKLGRCRRDHPQATAAPRVGSPYYPVNVQRGARFGWDWTQPVDQHGPNVSGDRSLLAASTPGPYPSRATVRPPVA